MGRNVIKRLFSVLLCFCLILVIAPAFSKAFAAEEKPSGDYVPDVIIIGFLDRSLFPGQEKQYDDEVAKVSKDGLTMVRDNVYVVKSQDFLKNPNATLNRYKNSKFVDYVEPDYKAKYDFTPNDPGYRTNQIAALTTITAPNGWDIITGGGPVIAVVDSGVVQHTDLSPLLPGYSAVSSLATNNDKIGHGTQVAGTIGAIGNNGKGGAGINWNASILPVKVDDANGTLTVANIAKGVMWATDNGAKVINLSLGTSSDSVTLKNAIDYAYNKGCAIFAASGNDGINGVCYPARYSNVMGIGGSSSGASRAPTSNYGTGLDVVAMGAYYTTTAAGGYSSVAGTSFASPQAAGLASLVWAVNPKLSNAQVYDLIRQNAKPLGGGFNEQTGYGLIDMAKTLSAAGGSSSQAQGSAVVTPAQEPAVDEPKYALPPTIKLSGSEEVMLNAGDEYVEAGYDAIDCLGVDLTAAVKVNTNLNTMTPGVYTIDYDVMDAGGNTARMTRTIVVTAMEIERPAPGEPVLTITGSNPIILHLGGTAYTEQGATVQDETDGDLSSQVQIDGVPDTTKAGTYTVTYSVVNSNGIKASATREVRVLAPTESVEREPYGFSGQGKVPTTISHKDIVAAAAGFMDFNVTKMDNKMTFTANLVNTDTDETVVSEKFSAVCGKQYFIEAGNYRLDVTIDGGNGNCSYKIDLLMPEVRTAFFAEKEVPFDPGSGGSGNQTLFIVIGAIVVAAALVLLLSKKKRNASKHSAS